MAKELKQLPVIYFDIDENSKLDGIKTISLVSDPAISRTGIYFHADKPKVVELKKEGYKNVFFAPVLVPEIPIYRNGKTGSYVGKFSKQVIVKLRDKFHEEGNTDRINVEHESTNYINAFVIESYILNSPELLTDAKNKGLNDLVDGTWVIALKVKDDETFSKIINGELVGFSIEAFLQQFIKDENNFNKQFENAMTSFLERFESLLAEFKKSEKKEETKLETAKSGDQTIQYGAVGEPVNILAEDGSATPAPDGDYTLDNGKVIIVSSGVATDIKDAPVEQAKEEPVKQKESNENFKNELETIKAELAKAKDELQKANDEITKLKKAPLTTPVVKTELKKTKKLTDDEFNNLSNVDRILYKKGLYEPKQ